MPRVDWSKSISITWDEKLRENSVVRVPGIKVPADPPTVRSRRALWELSSFYPRVFGAAYRFPLDTVAVNRGLKDGRGRTLVARDVEEPSGQMPLAVIGWHLSRRLEDPLLVIAASPRLGSGVSPTLEIIIETGSSCSSTRCSASLVTTGRGSSNGCPPVRGRARGPRRSSVAFYSMSRARTLWPRIYAGSMARGSTSRRGQGVPRSCCIWRRDAGPGQDGVGGVGADRLAHLLDHR